MNRPSSSGDVHSVPGSPVSSRATAAAADSAFANDDESRRMSAVVDDDDMGWMCKHFENIQLYFFALVRVLQVPFKMELRTDTSVDLLELQFSPSL